MKDNDPPLRSNLKIIILTLIAFFAYDLANRFDMVWIGYILLLVVLGMVIASIHCCRTTRRKVKKI